MKSEMNHEPDTSPTVGYYGKPIVRAHVWKDAIGWYFFTGGLAGASSVLAAAAELSGRSRLATHARRASMVGLLPSPVLLIVDLGRPQRFYNMLRVFKPSSPMSVGSWLLMAYSPAAAGAWVFGELGLFPRLRRALGLTAALIGPAIASYTAVLVADTATPAWHEAKGELPFVFVSSAAASAGAAANALSIVDGAPSPVAARIAGLGAGLEVGAATLMKKRLGDLDVYSTDSATKRLDRAAGGLSIGGAVASLVSLAVPSRWPTVRRAVGMVGSLAVLAGSICERLSVVRAGTASANDPSSVLTQQARRVAPDRQGERRSSSIASPNDKNR